MTHGRTLYVLRDEDTGEWVSPKENGRFSVERSRSLAGIRTYSTGSAANTVLRRRKKSILAWRNSNICVYEMTVDEVTGNVNAVPWTDPKEIRRLEKEYLSNRRQLFFVRFGDAYVCAPGRLTRDFTRARFFGRRCDAMSSIYAAQGSWTVVHGARRWERVHLPPTAAVVERVIVDPPPAVVADAA